MLAAYGELLVGAFGSRLSVTETLARATPLILTGLAAAVAFRARLWNIGGEGQFYLGALAAAALGGRGARPAGLAPDPGADGRRRPGRGVCLLLGPALLKTKLGVDEVVTTLLLNFRRAAVRFDDDRGPDEGPAGIRLAPVGAGGGAGGCCPT